MKRIVGLGFALLGVAAWAQTSPDPTDAIVELPKFVVTDTRELPPPEAWRYATLPGFEVLSNAADQATQRLLRDFDLFRQALGHVWPQPNRTLHPTSLIICGKRSKFESFVPEARYAPETQLASVFLKRGQQTAIVINLEATTLNVLDVDSLVDVPIGTDSGQIGIDHNKQLYREYVRYLLSRSEPRLPPWLEEGLAQIFMRMEFSQRWIVFAKLEDPNTISAEAAVVAAVNELLGEEPDSLMARPGAPAVDRDFNAALQRKALVPLETFFAVAHDSPEARSVLGNNRWAKQAYAFVHMCLYGLNGRYQKPFAVFLQRLSREPPSEELFKQVFKKTYPQMLDELRGYIDFTVYQHKEFRSRQDVIVAPPPLALRAATESEVGRIKGEAMVLAGNAKGARIELVAPYARGERDPYLLAALGLYEKNHGDPARAQKLLEAAFAGQVRRPDACLELARFRLADASAKPEAPNGRLSAAQTSAVLAPVTFAHGTPPFLPALYDVAGDAWARSAAPPTAADAKLMIEGARLFPSKMRLVFQAGVMARDTGDLRSAHTLADLGIRWSPPGAGKQSFEALKASLPPEPATKR